MGVSNHNEQHLCDGFNHQSWWPCMKYKKNQYGLNMYSTEWPKEDSGFSFPKGKFNYETPSNPRCLPKMCAGPHAAILPPFKPSCDFADNTNNGPGDESTNWYTCPNLPNPDFYSTVNKKSDRQYFFKSNLWRKPHLYGNNNKEWDAKAYRYTVDTYEKTPVSTKKVFMTRDIENGEVNTTFAGELLCDRTGAVAKQSILDDNLIYVCGGQTIDCDYLCELYSIRKMKSAGIENVSSECETGRTIGLQIRQSGNLSNFDESIGVTVTYACQDTVAKDPKTMKNEFTNDQILRGLPEDMKNIYYAKTYQQTNHYKTFRPQTFIVTNGNARAKATQGGKIDKHQLELSGTVCYTAGEAIIKYLAEDTHTSLLLEIKQTNIKVFVNGIQKVTKSVKGNKRTCISANNDIRQDNERPQSFFKLNPFSPTDQPFVTVSFFTSSEVLVSSLTAATILSPKNKNKTLEEIHADYRWATSNLGYVPDDTEEPTVGCSVYNNNAHCGNPNDCARDCPEGTCPAKCLSYYYSVLPNSTMRQIEFNIMNKGNSSKNQGYLSRDPLPNRFSGYRFHGRAAFTKIDSIITDDGCSNKSETEGFPFMELKKIDFLRLRNQPHFHEPKPELVIRSPEACTENTTQCHTFTVDKSDPTRPIRQCFHAVGCDQQEYVNTTGLLDIGNASVVNATELGICVGFEVCQRAVTATYTDISQHAGIQPKCRFVRACESQLYKRISHPFDDVLGNIKLGTCLPESKCSPAQFDRIASTYLEESECVEIQTCNESQFERNAPTKDSDRDCVIITECTEDEITAVPPTSTSDRQCVAIDITCDFNQYHDGEGCKDATVCALREREVSPLNTTVDRQCVEIEQCQFNQKLNYKTGSIELVCEDLKYTSEHEDIAILAVAGFVAACSLIFRLLVK
jgi:hypothetical protein